MDGKGEVRDCGGIRLDDTALCSFQSIKLRFLFMVFSSTIGNVRCRIGEGGGGNYN